MPERKAGFKQNAPIRQHIRGKRAGLHVGERKHARTGRRIQRRMCRRMAVFRGLQLKPHGRALRPDHPPAGQIERALGIGCGGNHLAHGAIRQRQFPYLPGIARGLLAREEHRLAVEGNIGVGGGRKARHQRLRLALHEPAAIARPWENAPRPRKRGQRLVNGRGGDDDVRAIGEPAPRRAQSRKPESARQSTRQSPAL